MSYFISRADAVCSHSYCMLHANSSIIPDCCISSQPWMKSLDEIKHNLQPWRSIIDIRIHKIHSQSLAKARTFRTPALVLCNSVPPCPFLPRIKLVGFRRAIVGLQFLVPSYCPSAIRAGAGPPTRTPTRSYCICRSKLDSRSFLSGA